LRYTRGTRVVRRTPTEDRTFGLTSVKSRCVIFGFAVTPDGRLPHPLEAIGVAMHCYVRDEAVLANVIDIYEVFASLVVNAA